MNESQSIPLIRQSDLIKLTKPKRSKQYISWLIKRELLSSREEYGIRMVEVTKENYDYLGIQWTNQHQ